LYIPALLHAISGNILVFSSPPDPTFISLAAHLLDLMCSALPLSIMQLLFSDLHCVQEPSPEEEQRVRQATADVVRTELCYIEAESREQKGA